MEVRGPAKAHGPGPLYGSSVLETMGGVDAGGRGGWGGHDDDRDGGGREADPSLTTSFFRHNPKVRHE